MTTRDHRRVETARVCRNRHRQWQRFENSDSSALRAGHFKATTPCGCHCRKTRKGRPRLASGLCKIDARGRIYRARKTAREMRHQARAGRPLDD